MWTKLALNKKQGKVESTEPCVQLASETCQLLQGSDTSVLPVPQRCVRRLLSLLSTAQTSLTSNSALSESRPLQMSQSNPRHPPRHTPAGCLLTPTLQGPEGGAAGRMPLPSSALVECHSTNPLCLCTVWPGSILADQGVPKGEASCWEHALLIPLLGSYKNNCTLPAPGSSQPWLRSCWLLQLWIESQPCALQAQFLCQLWLSFVRTPLTPKQSPFPFGSCSCHQSY